MGFVGWGLTLSMCSQSANLWPQLGLTGCVQLGPQTYGFVFLQHNAIRIKVQQ